MRNTPIFKPLRSEGVFSALAMISLSNATALKAASSQLGHSETSTTASIENTVGPPGMQMSENILTMEMMLQISKIRFLNSENKFHLKAKHGEHVLC